eukprot:TRINITY_DN85184_c0_g1_i1.p1 TRINITY_DN85184_c0_g1~~TRINITY_DN85184_c0_g1_i1.p1  ORF type:complete len:116 (+),score=16.31 TRINITY_DN85184_c0_g1_i1:44-391(+)
MALCMTMLRAMAKAAPKPRTGARPTSGWKQEPLPAVQPPPPAATPPPAGAGEGSGYAQGGSGGGLMYQILLGMGSMFGVIMAMQLVSRLFGPRRITVVHKDSSGNVIQEGSGRSL